MIYGCIGEHLPHSFSKEIHEKIGGYAYELREIAPDELESFMLERPFLAINVTIPYKQAVIPYLSKISETAQAIGAVNTIVNQDGQLHGFNTDFDGMTRLIRRLGIDLNGKKVLILGTGGTSRTAAFVARSLNAGQVLRVSRSGREEAITYEDVLSHHLDAQIIINTTPCGMFPHAQEQPLDLAAFADLSGVVDAIYNPLSSRLVRQAIRRGIKAEGGLYMLVAQAVRAAEIFRNCDYPQDITDRIYGQILHEKQNLVLTGMPASGKTSVGKCLANDLNREFVDTDQLITERVKMPVPEIFSRFGERFFRDLESEIIHGLSARNGLVVATGGGAVLRDDNVEALKQNGRVFFLDRPLDKLLPTEDRPLANSREKIERLYEERMPVYRSTADEIVPCGSSPREAARIIESRWLE